MSANRSRTRGGLSAAIAISALLVLLGCTPAEPEPTSAATPTPEATALEPLALIPDGSAADNLPLFDSVIAKTWGSEQRDQGRAYIDALVEAGFDKADMEVTNDLSTVQRAAETMQVAVAWGAECLVGQFGPSTGKPVTAVLGQVADGKCLIGNTREIDW